MKKTGAWLAVYALEQVGVRYTFGIPGVHNTELYDALDTSDTIEPILVTHEQSAAFMADAISRTTDSIGCLAIVPAAGLTHAMSGIGEAFLDGIPMLVITGGIRRDSGRHYQLHDVDQQVVARGLTKAAFVVTEHADVVPTIYRAYETATADEPGPVLVELAGDIQLFTGEVPELPPFRPTWQPRMPSPESIDAAVGLLCAARNPGLYLGWGARDGSAAAAQIAERLGAPVATTMQGLSVFPANHPLHTGFGFGPTAVPAARNAFRDCDCLLAVGVRFAELATGSYGVTVPENLIHVDINDRVFDKNYRAKISVHADGALALQAISDALERRDLRHDYTKLAATIAADKEQFFASWTATPSETKVSPGIFFRELRAQLADDAYVIVDDGNHTFLAAEQFPVHRPKHFISPTDFNCMGYATPAAIATKLSHPDKQVVAVVGDGAFLMTGLEILTATTQNVGAIFYVFHDGELAQISQFQQIPLNRKTCTVLGTIDLSGIALATGAAYLKMDHDGEVGDVLREATALSDAGQPVIVDVKIDYSRKSVFTTGIVKVNLGRFPLGQKVRFIGRAAKRHLLG